MGSGQQGELPGIEQLLLGIWYSFKRAPRSVQVILALTIIGFFGRFLGNNFFLSVLFSFLLYVGIFLLVVRFIGHRIVRREQVVDQWDILIASGQGKAENIFDGTRKLIADSLAPDIELRRESIGPGILRSIRGDKRDFLRLRNRTNGKLKTYDMYISARDYGNNLHVSWYLITDIGFWASLMLRMLLFVAQVPQPRLLVAHLDLFDLQDLTAYVTNAHHCLLAAVEKLMLDLSQDPSKIERKSRGFLGIS